MRALWGLVWLGLALGPACSVNDTVAVLPVRSTGEDAGGAPDGSVAPLDAGAPDGGAASGADGGTASACATPVRWVEDEATGREVCGARVASQVFTRGVCVCDRLVLNAASSLGGTVGLNGGLTANDAVSIQGPLQVGDAGIQLAARPLSVGASLFTGGPVLGPDASVWVAGDAGIGGDVALDVLEVGGVVSVPVGNRLEVNAPPARLRREPVGPFEPPCPCGPPARDVSASAHYHASANDNARIGLSPQALVDVADTRTLELDCGRFYLTGLRGSGRVSFSLRGRGALFVDGNVDIGELELRLEDDAQWDVLIKGDLLLRGAFNLGSSQAPSHLRLYVGQSVRLTPAPGRSLSAALYAPRAGVELGAALDMAGALFVRALSAGAGLSLRYDPEVLELEKTCPE